MIKKIFSYIKRAKYVIYCRSKFAVSKMFPFQQQRVIDNFHKLFYNSKLINKTWGSAKFLGTEIQKCPFDLFIYQEILFDVKPDLIIEAGTAFGGGALYLASMCDLIGKGKIVTIDVADTPNLPKHKRIIYIKGSSIAHSVINQVKSMIKKSDKVMVILDSDHSMKHVLQELKIYHKLVSKGSYLIVEDTNVNGHPVYKEHGPGPMEALLEFVKTNKNFIIDKTREKFYISFNPDGYLKRIK
jgi:cephalosporin hydroxylase